MEGTDKGLKGAIFDRYKDKLIKDLAAQDFCGLIVAIRNYKSQ